MESVVLFQATGVSGSLKYKYLEVASFANWQLNARNRDEWTVHIEKTISVDSFALREYGDRLDVELRLSFEHKGSWHGTVEVANVEPFVLKGIGSIEADE